jgi:hypothetical protein
MRFLSTRTLLGLWICALLLNGCATSTTSTSSAQPTEIVVRLLDLNQVPVTLAAPEMGPPTPTSTPVVIQMPSTATPTPAQAASASQPAQAAASSPTVESCHNSAEFVKNLMTSDNTILDSGTQFAKIWRIRNSGTCVWTKDYTIAFYSGEPMGGQPSITLPDAIKPGETVDIRLNLIAPEGTNTYTGNWVFKDAAGNPFGLGPAANQPLALTIIVPPKAAPTSG